MNAHQSLGHQLAWIVASSMLFVTGCPQNPEENPVDTGAEDMPSGNTSDMPDMAPAPDLDGSPDLAREVDMTRPPAPDQPEDITWEVTLRMEPVEWGLDEDSAPLPAPIEQTLVGDAGVVFSFTLPAGMWRPVLTFGDEGRPMTLDGDGTPTGLARPVNDLVDLEGDEKALLFSAVDEPIEVEVSGSSVAIRRTEPEAAPDPDALERPVRVGHLFDEALSRIDSGEDDTRAVLDLMDALREVGASPVASSRGAFFLAPYDNLSGEAGAPQARGDFNGWVASDSGRMRRVVGDLFGRFIQLEPGRHQYKLAYPGADGDAWFTDRSNRHIRWDGFNPGTIGSFNSVVDVGQVAPESRMVLWMQVASQELGNEREVYIHLPASYDTDPTRRYPVLYVHDGNESIVRSQFHEVADAHARDGGEEIILVFVALPSQDVRFAEYTMASEGSRGDQYSAFLARELVPMIDAAFRTRASPAARGLVGASLGGLISFWTGAQYSGTFEYVAGMSSSFFWADQFMISEIEKRGCQGVRYYIDSGSPNDNADVTRIMRDTLSGLGCDFEHVEQTGGTHDWSFWKERFPNVLRTFEQKHGAPTR